MAKSLWDEFKDLFKTGSQREQEKRDKLNDALKEEKDVVKQLEELEKQYLDSLPEDEGPDLDALFPADSGYKEIEYSVDDDEEIERKAKEKTDAEKALAQEKLQNKYASDASSVEEGRQKAVDSLRDEFKNLEETYGALADRAKEKAVENGVARGSVLSSTLNKLGDEKQESGQEAAARYRQKIDAIDNKLSALAEKLDGALEELDMKYAIELESDIQKLKEERDKQVEKYEKYNADIRAKQDKYAREREEDIAEYLKRREEEEEKKKRDEEAYEMAHGYEGEKQKNYAERYDIAYEFYMSLDPDIAYDALKASPNMQYYLGYYYDQLQKALKERAGIKTVY